jgi:hypothetical protein
LARTTRPVLNADDLGFIIRGLITVRSDYSERATSLAKQGEHMLAGEQLEVGVMVNDLIERLDTLRNDIFNDLMSEMMAHAAEDDDPQTDEVGTVPMDEFIADPSDAAEPA